MKRTRKLGRAVGALAVGFGLMSISSCGDDASNPLNDVCDLSCPDKGIAEGNASISGFVSIDAFFSSVVNFGKVANGVSADIKAELGAIQAAFGITNADIKAAGSLDAAITAKLEADFNAELVVDAQPPQCTVDASFTAKATAKCQAEAECDVDPGKASVTCEGTCTVEASAEGSCEANAEVKCEVSGPSLECMGECSGSCALEFNAAAACEGTCNGECSGECVGDTDSGAGCSGQCTGTCKGTCEVSGMAALNCQGKCSGSCSYTPPSAECEANANVKCELKAEAKAECTGSCDGEFEPPKADCDASASCEASAKADAKFNATCTPPSLNIAIKANGTLSAEVQAQLDFAVSELKIHLPRLLASLKKSEIVLEAGADLGDKGSKAIKSTLSALADGDVELVAAYRIGKCVPSQLDASAKVITDSGKTLQTQVEAATKVTGAIGM